MSGHEVIRRFSAHFLLLLLPGFALAQPMAPGRVFREDRILVIPKAGRAAEFANFHGAQRTRILRRFPRLGDVHVLELPRGANVPALLNLFQRSGLVEVAEPDHLFEPAVLPNDPSFVDGSLWHLHNTGQNFGTPDADIDAPEGWDTLHSASNIIVAVVDTGVRYTHQDLVANMWVNPGEIPGNNLDDDSNGFIDDVHGIDATTSNPALAGKPTDDRNHGSHVAGILGAVGNNGLGVCGVAWKPRIMACKFINASGGSESDLIQCLDYARTNGAKVINCSFVAPAGTFGFNILSNAFWQLRTAGIVVAAAAGNSGANNDISGIYPASFQIDNIVAVAATTRADTLWSASNYGATTVDLAAPGVDIYSTGNSADNSYFTLSGTSMATPMVAGALALLRERFPSETPQQIIARLFAAVDPLPGLAGTCKTGGRLNLAKVLSSPRLTAWPSLMTGEFQMQLSAMPGQTCVLLASTNLIHWSPIQTNTIPVNGVQMYTNATGGTLPRRFYRAQLGP